MAEYPALPLFTDAYLADTRHLTTLQHGAYLLLLIVSWRSQDCALPNDDIFLSRICGLNKREWTKNKDIILSFFTLSDNNKLVQKRLLDERIYVEDKREKNIAAGRLSALKRKKRHSTNVSTNVPTERQRKPNQPTPTPNIDTKVSKDPPIPEWIPKELWFSYMEVRKKLKCANTNKAIKLLIGKLDGFRKCGVDINQVIELSIVNSWKSFYKPKENINGTYRADTKSDRERRAALEGARLIGIDIDERPGGEEGVSESTTPRLQGS
jgi:uncharacterized protein YdaU (DUF1376 family)